MEIERRTQPLDAELSWHPAGAEPFPGRAVELVAIYRDGALAEVRLVFSLSPEAYARVERERHFHLEPAFRSEGPAGGFRPGEDISVEAALDASAASRLAPADPFAGAAAGLREGGELLDPALWFACYVFQTVKLPGEMPPMRSGYGTAWNQRFRAGSPGEARGPIYAAFVEFLLHDLWPFAPLPGEAVIRTDYRGRHGQWICYARVIEDAQQIVFYSVYPETVPEAKRAAVAEYITRVNYRLAVGNFEMDFGDGEVRFRTSLDLDGVTPDPALFRPLVLANIHTMDNHLPGFVRIIRQGLAPHEALADLGGL